VDSEHDPVQTRGIVEWPASLSREGRPGRPEATPWGFKLVAGSLLMNQYQKSGTSLIPAVQHTTDGDGPVGSRVNGGNDTGNETKYSSVRPTSQHQRTHISFSSDLTRNTHRVP